jgi:hypothetical protein
MLALQRSNHNLLKVGENVKLDKNVYRKGECM